MEKWTTTYLELVLHTSKDLDEATHLFLREGIENLGVGIGRLGGRRDGLVLRLHCRLGRRQMVVD